MPNFICFLLLWYIRNLKFIYLLHYKTLRPHRFVYKMKKNLKLINLIRRPFLKNYYHFLLEIKLLTRYLKNRNKKDLSRNCRCHCKNKLLNLNSNPQKLNLCTRGKNKICSQSHFFFDMNSYLDNSFKGFLDLQNNKEMASVISYYKSKDSRELY